MKAAFIKRLCLMVALPLMMSKTFAQKKPNILWITIEDTSPQFVGCYGNKNASTPNIDRLAKNGVRFTNAFSTGTVCSPSRTAIITGVRTFETGTGHHRSDIPVPGFMHGFPYYLQQAGYYVTNNNKTDYNVANEKQYIQDAWNESSKTAGWWNRKPGQPFFAVFNYMDSHQSRTMTDSYQNYLKEVINQLPEADRIGQDSFDMPPFYRDSPEMRKQFARVYNAIKLTDNKIGELLKRLDKDKLTDSTIIFFYGDHGEGIPRGKTNGINLGYRVPFVVWFPPMYKYLSPWGTGVITDELVDFEDLAPTLINLAGGQVPGYMKGRTLIGNKRSPARPYRELSSDRSDNGIDMVRTVTDGRYVYSRNYMPFMPEARYINYMEIGEIKKIMRSDLATGQLNAMQKKLFELRPAEFLFDIKNDIWELKNLTTDAKYTDILKRMRKQLDESVMESKDVMFLPEYELVRLSKSTTPYEFRVDGSRYPLKAVYAAASLSGFRGKNYTQKQVALLNDANQWVRYWAVIGLRSQSDNDLQPYRAQILKAMHDAYAPVSITAAAIAYDQFKNLEALNILKQQAASPNGQLALMVINYLLYTPNQQPFIETIQSVKQNPSTIEDVKWACNDFLNALGIAKKKSEQ